MKGRFSTGVKVKFTPSPIVAQWKQVGASYKPLGGDPDGAIKAVARYRKFAEALEASVRDDLKRLEAAKASGASAAKDLPGKAKKSVMMHKDLTAYVTALAALENTIGTKLAQLKKQPKNKDLEREIETLIKKHKTDSKAVESRIDKLMAFNAPLDIQHSDAMIELEEAMVALAKARRWS